MIKFLERIILDIPFIKDAVRKEVYNKTFLKYTENVKVTNSIKELERENRVLRTLVGTYETILASKRKEISRLKRR